MFSPDIIAFRQFYASPLGNTMRHVIATRIRRIWPEIKGDSILGLGYTSPYLEAYLEESSDVIVCMPAHQGAAYWPAEKANRVFLAHESSLPLPENSINRILMVHSVENSEQLSWMMEEAWRVLTPGGRVLLVVPNRLGLWSHFGNNPFGYGRPFSKTQMKELLSEHEFTLLRTDAALYQPPTNNLSCCRLAYWFENAGRWLYPFMAGVLLIEAEKQLYASIRQPVLARRNRKVPVRVVKPAMGLKNNAVFMKKS